MGPYPSGQFGFIDDPDRQFGNGSVWTRTRTRSDGPELLLTLVTNMLEAQAAREEAQWRGTLTWMQEREQKLDACHEDNKLWGAGITNMIAKVMEGVAPGQEAREKERDKTSKLDGGGREASQHADTTQKGGPE